MWMTYIFQTLPAQALEKYLPSGKNKLWASQHLNIVAPVWQSFSAVSMALLFTASEGKKTEAHSYLTVSYLYFDLHYILLA